MDADDGGNVDLEFRAVDCVRWERFILDIRPLENEQALLDAMHNGMDDLLNAAEGRPVIARVTLKGRGELNRFLGRANALEDLAEQINEAWTGRAPFAWCERIEDATAPAFDRKARLAGSDFLAEVLRTADHAKARPELLDGLRDGTSGPYEHHRFRRYLSGDIPNQEEFAALMGEAETMAVNLLAEDGE